MTPEEALAALEELATILETHDPGPGVAAVIRAAVAVLRAALGEVHP